jgi:GTP-binding protein
MSPSLDFPATFICSLAVWEDLPAIGPEGVIGFAGRSNVGKSSLINRLARRNHLARVGRTPGKTTLANLYRLDKGGYFLDLPGYGYMKRDKETAAQARRLATEFVEHLPGLKRILLMVDVRRGILDTDLDALDWLRGIGIPVTILVSKIDLEPRRTVREVQAEWERLVSEIHRPSDDPLTVAISSRTSEGIDTLARLIARDLYGHPIP